MAENYLFTSTAFSEYTSTLTKDGYMMIIPHSITEGARLVMNILQSFNDRGISSQEAITHLAIMEIRKHRPIIILKNSPIEKEEAEKLFELYEAALDKREGINFIPYIPQREYKEFDADHKMVTRRLFNNFFVRLAAGEITKEMIINASAVNVKPTDDNRPFFYHFDDGIPGTVVIIFLIAAALAAFFFLSDKQQRPLSFHFIILGLAFIMIEIGFLQKFGFFWGQNTFSLALLLTIILLSTGAGSFLAKIVIKNDFMLKLIIVFISLLSIVSVILHNTVLDSFEHVETAVKIIISILFITPQFFFMGMIFPSLLSRTADTAIPKMLAINSIATVAGTVLALMIAMTCGFISVMVLGGLLYVLVLIQPRKAA